MIVVDASVGVELLLQLPTSGAVMDRVFDEAESVHVPHLFDVEVAQVVRRYWRRGELSAARAAIAIADLGDLPWRRHSHGPLLDRIWALRQNATAYDAAYLALAEALDGTLITRDHALAAIPGARATIEVL